MDHLKSGRFVLSLIVVMVCWAAACTQSSQPAAGDPPAAGAEIIGNSACPVSDKPVAGSAKNPTFYSDFKGMRVGFMCPNCKGTFDSAADDKKLELINKALSSVGRDPLGAKPAP